MFQELMNKKAIKKRIHKNRKTLIAGLVAIGVAVVIGVLCLVIALLMNARTAKAAAAAATPTPTPTPVVTAEPQTTEAADAAKTDNENAEAAESESADNTEASETEATPVPTAKVGPTITKSPYNETVTSGGTVVFVAHAKNYKTIEWRLVSEDTYTSYDMETAARLYGFWYTGADTESITMGSVLISLDGWKVQACFTDKNGNSSYTDFAQIHVVRPTW